MNEPYETLSDKLNFYYHSPVYEMPTSTLFEEHISEAEKLEARVKELEGAIKEHRHWSTILVLKGGGELSEIDKELWVVLKGGE